MDMTPAERGIPESLQDRLEEYNKNFERLGDLLGDQSLTEAAATRAVQTESTKDLLAAAQQIAVKTIIALAANADSESVKYNASKLILEFNLGKDPALKAEDPAMDLIDRLKSDPILAEGTDHVE